MGDKQSGGTVYADGTSQAYQRSRNYAASYTDKNGTVWYDIADGKVNADRPTDIYDLMLTALTYQRNNGKFSAPSDHWARIAASIYAQYPETLFHTWDDKPFSYMYGGYEHGVYMAPITAGDPHYAMAVDALGGHTGYSWVSLSGIADLLSDYDDAHQFVNSLDQAKFYSPGYGTGNHGSDGVLLTGWRKAGSLKDAADDFYSLTSYMRNDPYSNGYYDFKAANKKALSIPFLDNDTQQPVIYAYMGTLEHNSPEWLTSSYEYTNFGIIYYNFRLVPINTSDTFYWSDDVEARSTKEDPEITPCSGFDLTTTGEVPHTTMEINDGGSEKTGTANTSTTYSETATTTFSNSETYTAGQTLTTDFPEIPILKTKFHLNISFSEAWNNVYTESNAKSTTSADSSTVNFPIPAYSVAMATNTESNMQSTIAFRQPVAIKYNVAIIAARGHFYDDNVGINDSFDPGHSFVTIFGDANQNLEANGTDDDAITALNKRVNGNVESNYYTCFMTGDKQDTNKQLVWSRMDTPVTDKGKEKPRGQWLDGKTGFSDPPYDFAKAVNWLVEKGERMSITGGEMKVTQKTTTFYMPEIVTMEPLGGLSDVKTNQLGNTTIFNGDTIKVGDTMAMSTIGLQGVYPNGTAYPKEALDVRKGAWHLCDNQGNLIDTSEVLDLYTDPGGNLMLQGKAAGTGYLIYVLKTGAEGYTYYDKYTKEINPIDTSSVRVPFLTFTVKKGLFGEDAENTDDGATISWEEPEDGDAVSYDIQIEDDTAPADDGTATDDAGADGGAGDGTTSSDVATMDDGSAAAGTTGTADASTGTADATTTDASVTTDTTADATAVTGQSNSVNAAVAVTNEKGAKSKKTTELTDDWKTIKTIRSAKTTSFTDTDVTNGQYRTYRIVARDKNGNIVAVSSPINNIWLKAVGLKKYASTPEGKALLEWSKNAEAKGVQIQYRMGDDEGWESVYIKDRETLKHDIEDLVPGETYRFRIRAYAKKDGQRYYSRWSKVRTVTIPVETGDGSLSPLDKNFSRKLQLE